MKLRIKGDSLRLRISPSEMACLLETGRIEDAIHFGEGEGARLTYALEHGVDGRELRVRYRPGEIAVVVPSDVARAWGEGSEVGLYGDVSIGEGWLELAIEKDLACLDKKDGENQDTFPNPHEGAIC
jgi:hypothetical protein